LAQHSIQFTNGRAVGSPWPLCTALTLRYADPWSPVGSISVAPNEKPIGLSHPDYRAALRD